MGEEPVGFEKRGALVVKKPMSHSALSGSFTTTGDIQSLSTNMEQAHHSRKSAVANDPLNSVSLVALVCDSPAPAGLAHTSTAGLAEQILATLRQAVRAANGQILQLEKAKRP